MNLRLLQIKIVSNKVTCEKAVLESVEKERGDLNLPLTSPCTSSGNVADNSDALGHTMSSCKYRSEIIKFKKTMVLPGNLQATPIFHTSLTSLLQAIISYLTNQCVTV